MTIIHDLVDGATLTGFTREVPSPANYVLNQILPDVYINDIEATINRVTKTNRAAKFRSWDAETPIGKRPTGSQDRVALPPVGQKTVIGEFERLRLEALRLGGNANAALADAVYDDAAINTGSVLARVELARGDLLEDGVVTIDENGLEGLEADFGIDSSHKPTASVSFDDEAADPIEELLGWVNDVYIPDAGEPPAQMWTSNTVLAALLRNEAIRALAASLVGAPNIVSRAQLDQVLQAFGLPVIRTYDTRIDVDGTATRPIAEDKLIFVPSDPRSLGMTAWGITAEALELVGDNAVSFTFSDAAGLVGVVMKDGDPVRTWTKVTGVCLPIIEDPAKFFAADVLTPGS